MRKTSGSIVSVVLASLVVSFDASALVTTTFASPNGRTEECRILSPLPGGKYSKKDQADATELCSIDFYDTTKIALCPKTWSTSPGTMVYSLEASGLGQREYESQSKCGGSKSGHKKLTKYKQSMHQSGTSGTFSPSSLLYFHFSRYFDAQIKVPVSVYRSMDKDSHFARVTKKAHEQKMGQSKMIRAGWDWLYRSEKNPQIYEPTSELFTDSNQQIFGSMGDGGGERYGPEFNGVRSKWGEKQNYEFQETPGFTALRTDRPLVEAIAVGLADAQKSSAMRQAMGGGASDFQMALWMRDLTEIVILDYIFSQQDRIGNIDYDWYYYWADASGNVKSKKLDSDLPRSAMKDVEFPDMVEGAKTHLVQRTRVNDNDAGGKKQYRNYTKVTKMLESLRHIDQDTYARLLALNADFQSQGPIFQQLRAEFTLTESQVDYIVENTKSATAILVGHEKAGRLRFDLGKLDKMFLDLAN